MPFKSLGAVSYSPSIVTIAVSAAILKIFSVKEWPDLEIWVWGQIKSNIFDNTKKQNKQTDENEKITTKCIQKNKVIEKCAIR